MFSNKHSGGGNSDPLSVQTLSGAQAVTCLNGATPNGGGGYIRWIQLNGVKIVETNLYITLPKTHNFTTCYGQIPQNLAPAIGAVAWRSLGGREANGSAMLTEIDKEGKLWANSTEDYFLAFQTMYIHVDKN